MKKVLKVKSNTNLTEQRVPFTSTSVSFCPCKHCTIVIVVGAMAQQSQPQHCSFQRRAVDWKVSHVRVFLIKHSDPHECRNSSDRLNSLALEIDQNGLRIVCMN